MPITDAEVARRVAGETVARRFATTVHERGGAVALRWKDGDGYRTLTFSEYADLATRVAAGFGALGVGRGTRVALLVRNRPEFHVADVAALLTGATPISIYNSSSPDQIRYVAGHARAEVVVVESGEFLERLLAVRDDLPALREVVVIGDGYEGTNPWSELVAADPVELDAAASVARPDDLVTVIYTSGTTGEPKGVMLDHANICWTIESLRVALGYPSDGFRLVSYLPMAHIAERMVTHYSGIRFGYEVTTCPDLRELATYLRETRPELLFGVPRTYEKINSGLRAFVAADPGKNAEFDHALEIGLEVDMARARGEEPSAELSRRFEAVDATALRPVRELLGLDALRVAVTAAAPIPVEVLHFFRALGVPLSELYGLSESSGPAAWAPSQVRVGTVGPPIPGLELRLGDDGEVIMRGGNVFRGYLDDPERTAEALDPQGWLHTGDIGALDDDGYLRIVDRKKELIITAGGKNISPANLEAALKAQPLIGQACVIGDDEPYVVALLVLDPDVAPVWAAQHGVAADALPDLALDPVVLAEVEREVDEANRNFSHAEQVRRFRVLGDDWLPDSDELTPTMKLKRRGILTKYALEIAELYASG
ncbi:MAG TPA: long-chain fatty acid--CoA ligase [Acidimicrobiia bacterium]|nr:long-chain fatty acid--CoA ligase [Acidimicrobiia bacterium]